MAKKLVVKGRFRIILNRDKLLEDKLFELFRLHLLKKINEIAISGSQGFWIPEMSQKLEIFKLPKKEKKIAEI